MGKAVASAAAIFCFVTIVGFGYGCVQGTEIQSSSNFSCVLEEMVWELWSQNANKATQG